MEYNWYEPYPSHLLTFHHRRHKLTISNSVQPDASRGLGPNNKANANGYLQYNEYIVYDVAQLKLRYLFRIRMT